MKDETGYRLRGIRTLRNMTQAEVGERSGLSDAAIRLYELGKRKPSGSIVKDLAETLDIAPESLHNLTPESDREALEMLFRLEEDYGCRPRSSKGDCSGVCFSYPYTGLEKMIDVWAEVRAEYEAGRITKEEYEEWKMRYRG